MKVWYCTLHESLGNDVACDLWDVTGEWGNTISPCQIVEMQLVPVDARMVRWCEEHLCGNLPNSDTADWSSVPGQSGVCFFAEEFGSETNCRMVEMQLSPAPPKDPWDYDP